MPAPPGIAHREIVHSDDFELLEITIPAAFETKEFALHSATRMRRISASLILLVSLLGRAALSQPVATPLPISIITFMPGSTLSTVNGQMVLGGCELYHVLAKAGQTMLVSVASDADVTFQVYGPDATVAKAADGRPLIQGRTLLNAGADDNAKAWVGALPRTGNYLIAVGMPETGPVVSPYSLTVSLQ